MGKMLEKLNLEPAAAAAILTGSLAIGGGIAALEGRATETAGDANRETIQAIEKVAQTENAEQTLAALEEKRIKATSETIQGRTMRGWGTGINLASAVATGIAVSRIGKKRKPGDVADERSDQEKGRG